MTDCRRPNCTTATCGRRITLIRQATADMFAGPFCDRHTDMLIANLTPGTYTVTTSETSDD